VIEFLIYHQAFIREVINGSAFVLLGTLTIMIGVYLWDTWVMVAPRTYEQWRSVPGVPTACTLWWIFAAECYRTFSVWLSYSQGRIIVELLPAGYTVGYLLAGAVFNAALLSGIYNFTPPALKARVWVYAMVAALLFVISPTIMRMYIDAQ
jgi:hypothetical protein